MLALSNDHVGSCKSFEQETQTKSGEFYADEEVSALTRKTSERLVNTHAFEPITVQEFPHTVNAFMTERMQCYEISYLEPRLLKYFKVRRIIYIHCKRGSGRRLRLRSELKVTRNSEYVHRGFRKEALISDVQAQRRDDALHVVLFCGKKGFYEQGY